MKGAKDPQPVRLSVKTQHTSKCRNSGIRNDITDLPSPHNFLRTVFEIPTYILRQKYKQKGLLPTPNTFLDYLSSLWRLQKGFKHKMQNPKAPIVPKACRLNDKIQCLHPIMGSKSKAPCIHYTRGFLPFPKPLTMQLIT